MAPSSAVTSPTAPSTPPSTTAANAASATVDKDMFLQLLVAQLKNQDPLNPTDSTQFVTQLAQFQQLEQSVNTGEDVSAIRQDIDNYTGPTPTTTTTGNNAV
jgi:flagellar basal-body rod modification protein FlgD